MTILPNAIYRFNETPIKLLMAFFTELEQKISQFIRKHKSPSQSSLEKEEWCWRNQPSWLHIIPQRYSHQDSMILAQNIDQWNKIEIPEINPCPYRYLIFDKGGKNIQWAKDSLFNKWCWENWTATHKRMKLEHFLIPYTKINSKWIKDLNVRPETIKLLEENIGRTLNDINQSKILHDPPPSVMEIKTKVNKWNLIKRKGFCTAKDTISKVKRQSSEWEKIIANESTYPLSYPSPPAFNLSQHQGLFQWVSSSHHVAKVLEFQL